MGCLFMRNMRPGDKSSTILLPVSIRREAPYKGTVTNSILSVRLLSVSSCSNNIFML